MFIVSIMFLFFALFTLISGKQIPFCIHCKFYTKPLLTSSEFGKCLLFPIEKNNDYFVVNGKQDHTIDYNYCSTARKFMCIDAEFYEKKVGF